MPTATLFPARPSWLFLLFLVVLGLGCVLATTRRNAFPYTYHPDEDTKVRQVVTGKRNFFHPLLLLSVTSSAYRSGFFPQQPLQAAITGRWVSASFLALAIISLTWLAWRWGGWLSALGAAALLVLNPLGFELAHYFKEDTALLFGLALTFLALDLFCSTPTPRTAAFLGLASALAISGKYLGACILLIVLPLLYLRSRRNMRLALWFFAALLLTLLIVNFPLVRHWADFSRGLGREMVGATGGHRGLGRDVPHLYYLEKLREITPTAECLGLGLLLGLCIWQWKKQSAARLLTFLFPILFIALLSFSPKTATRYALPATILISFLAGSTPGLLQQAGLPARFRVPLVGLSILLITTSVAHQLPIVQNLVANFATDARDNLRQWLDAHTPPDAVIAQDERVDLLAASQWHQRRVLSAEFVADLGTLPALQALGVSYIAISRQTYQRFLSDKYTPHPTEKAAFERRQAFYRHLTTTRTPVWQSPTGAVIYLRPGLQLYRIAPLETSATP